MNINHRRTWEAYAAEKAWQLSSVHIMVYYVEAVLLWDCMRVKPVPQLTKSPSSLH
jgi:hypothetical protein